MEFLYFLDRASRYNSC